MEYKSFASACMAIFGKNPSTESLAEFQAEIKALTPEDRQDLINGMAKMGDTILNMPSTGSY